jgi:pantothenate kinase
VTRPDRRFVLGVTGPPGAGKSTIAAALVDAFGPTAVLVPMDGFHHTQRDLEDLGRAGRKGAPDTFDADAYVALLEQLRAAPDHAIAAPAFDRERDDPVPDAVVVLAAHRIVVTEGNYLLVEVDGWERIGPLLDQCWYVDSDDADRLKRLIARHVEFGRSPAEAERWVMRSDEANARLVEATRDRADRVVRLDDDLDGLVFDLGTAADQTR